MRKPARVVKIPQRNTLAVPMNDMIAGYLDELVGTGLYGSCREDAARRLLETKLEDLLIEYGIIGGGE